MRLRRTTLDRPEFAAGPRQPTCYDVRDPLRPWLAAQLDAQDDDADIELLRTAAKSGSIAPALLDGVYDPEQHDTMIRHPAFEDPGIVSTHPAPVRRQGETQQACGFQPDQHPIRRQGRIHYVAGHPPPPRRAAAVPDTEKVLPALRAGEHLDFAYRVGVDALRTDGLMRFAVEIEDHVAGRAQVRLQADNEGLVLTTFAATEGVIRFVVDLPRWVDKRTVHEMIQSGRFEQVGITERNPDGVIEPPVSAHEE